MTEALEALVVCFGLVLVRTTACAVALPLIGQLDAIKIRAAVVLVLSMVLTAALPPDRGTIEPALVPLLVAAFGEAIVGLAIGVCARLVLLAGEVAGQIIGVPMGMEFMQVVDPLSGDSLAVTSRFYLVLTVLVFVILGGHHSVVFGLATSFRVCPLGAGIPSGDVGWYVNTLAGSLLRSGVALAAPVLVATLAVQIGLGIIARAAPRVQVFFIGFALATIVGLLVLIATAPEMIVQLGALTLSLEDWLAVLLIEARSP